MKKLICKSLFIVLSLSSFFGAAFANGPKSSFQKIDEALEKNEISAADAKGLKVLAFFADKDLSQKFASDADAVVESDSDKFLASAQNSLVNMSRPLAIKVFNYIIPEPFRANISNKSDEEDFPKPSEIPNQEWTYLDDTIINVRVWYKKDEPDQLVLAAKLIDELKDIIIPKIKLLTGHTHISDAFVNSGIQVSLGLERGQPNGGDGKLDIYLYNLVSVADGEAPPKAWVQHYKDIDDGIQKCKSNASYMAFNWNWAKNQKDARIFSTLAHEYFHVIQNTYDRKNECIEYDNVDEGTATWIKHYVYPDLNDEHNMFQFSEDGHMSLLTTAHESWPYYFYLAQTFGTATIPKIYEMMANNPPYDAVNAAVPGGFKETWPEYSLYEWNQDPLQDTFRYWDKYLIVPGRGTKVFGHLPKIEKEKVELNLNGQFRKNLEIELKPLTRDFYAFDVSDENIRSISIDNPIFLNNKSIKVKVMVRKRGASQAEEFEWNNIKREVYTFCLDKKDESIEEILIVLANYRHEKNAPTYHGESAVQMTNQGCNKFRGKMSSFYNFKDGSQEHKIDVIGKDIILAESGFNEAGGFKGHFHAESGAVSYTYNGTIDGCTGFASGMVLINSDPKKVALSLYPYNVAPNAWGQYFIAVPLQEEFFKVTYVCPPPKKSFEAQMPLSMHIGQGIPHHRGFAVLKGKTPIVQQGWSTEWEFRPERE